MFARRLGTSLRVTSVRLDSASASPLTDNRLLDAHHDDPARRRVPYFIDENAFRILGTACE